MKKTLSLYFLSKNELSTTKEPDEEYKPLATIAQILNIEMTNGQKLLELNIEDERDKYLCDGIKNCLEAGYSKEDIKIIREDDRSASRNGNLLFLEIVYKVSYFKFKSQ